MSVENIIAYLLTDGGISADGRIYVANTSDVLIEDFRKEIIETFGPQKFSFNRAGSTKIIRFSSAKARKILLAFSPSYRTRACKKFPQCPRVKNLKCRVLSCLKCESTNGFPPTKIPDIIMNGNKEIKQAFLMRVFSADGGPVLTERNRRNYLEIRRMIVLSCSNPTIQAQYMTLLSEFGIKPRKNGIQLQIERKEDIEKFKSQINFLPCVTVTKGKRWKGVEKRKVLEFMCLPRPKVRPW
jgi:hypothetical protein